jgi:hypothetical protein
MAKIRKHAFMLLFVIVLLTTFTVTIWLTILFASYPGHPEAEESIRVEIVKSLLQLAIVIIIGGVVATLFKTEEQRRDRLLKAEEQRREHLRLRAETRADYLKRLSKLYRDVKAARRALRTGGLTTKYPTSKKPISINSVQIGVYKEQMERINEAQLELEGLKIEAKSLPDFASLESVSERLEQMEKYLGDIISEFEEIYPLMQISQPITPDKLKHLDEYTGDKYRNSVDTKHRFKADFSEPYSEVIGIISRQLIIQPLME